MAINKTVIPRRALIGELMRTADGVVGTVTGINTDGIARVVTGDASYIDVPQDTLTRVKPDFNR